MFTSMERGLLISAMQLMCGTWRSKKLSTNRLYILT